MTSLGPDPDAWRQIGRTALKLSSLFDDHLGQGADRAQLCCQLSQLLLGHGLVAQPGFIRHLDEEAALLEEALVLFLDVSLTDAGSDSPSPALRPTQPTSSTYRLTMALASKW